MADPRTFVLIGDFQDNITPALESINNSIAGLKRTMSSMATRRGGGFSDVTQSVGKLISSQKHLANSIKEVGDAAKTATGELKEYKSMVGKVASAHYHIAKAGQQAGDKIASGYSKALTNLDRLDRREKLMATARRQRMRNLSMTPVSPRSSRSRSMQPTASPRMGGGGRGMGYGGSFDMPAFAFGMTMGQGISQPITAAVLSGFQLGVGLLQQSFQYISSSFAERVQDQMTDLQAAGGYFSISKRQKNPMFTTLQQSVMFTQRTNDVLERLAGDLPGSTEDYVKVSKRIGDSVMRLVDSNEKGAIDYAKELMQKGGLQESYRGVNLEGPAAREAATQVILGELTKKTVLAGFGGTTGRGGPAGAYGLPALMERLITNPDTSMAQLQKYASVFGDPKIMSALDRAMPELQKAGSDMLARTKVINGMLDEISPPEMIAAMRKSMAGVLEAYRSAFFSPGTGLFGFGRKLKDASGKLQPLTDVYGRFIRTVEENGKKVEQVVKTAAEADQVDMDVFNMFADIVSNYAAILKPIVDNLYQIWDPLQGIADALRQARIISIEVLQTFRNYVAGLEKFAEGITDKGLKDAFLSTKSFRATLLTISNIFTQLGIFSEADFYKIQKKIIDPKTTMQGLGDVLKSLSETFFSSEAATEVGKFFGRILREVVIVLAQITDFGAMLGKSNLASGLAEGFGKEGFEALEKMFKNIYGMIFWAIGKAISSIPPSIIAKIAGYALASSLVLAGIAGLGIAIGVGVARLFGRLAAGIGQKIASGSMLANCLSSMVGASCGAGGAVGAGGPRGKKPGGLVNRIGQSFLLGGGTSGGKRSAVPYMKAGTTHQTGVRSPAFRAMPTRTPDFPQVALPGAAPRGVGGLGGMYTAPGIPKRTTSPARSPMGLLGKVKTKGVGTIMAGMLSLSNQAPKLAKAGAAVTKIARVLPGGAIAFGAVDAGLRMLGGQKAGQAVGGAASATAGSMAGAALGSLIAPGIGTAIGGIAGGIIGDKLFSVISDKFSAPAKLQEDAAQKQMAASLQQLQAAKQKLGGLGVEAPAGAQGIADPMKLGATIRMLGLESDKLVTTYQQNVERARMLSDQTQSAKDALFSKVEELKKLGYDPALIWKQTDIQALQKDYTTLQKTLGEATKSVDNSFKALPQHVSRAIVTNMQKMSLKKAEDVLAMKFANMKMPQFQFQPPTPNSYYPGATPPLFGYPPPPPKPNKGGVPDLFTWSAFGSPGKKAAGLGAALAYENKHKPPGSKIVIANSSERIIPAAANGYIPSQSLYSRGYAGWDSSGEMTVNAPITINGAGQNAEEIAIRVADLLGDAIATARSRSLFT